MMAIEDGWMGACAVKDWSIPDESMAKTAQDVLSGKIVAPRGYNPVVLAQGSSQAELLYYDQYCWALKMFPRPLDVPENARFADIEKFFVDECASILAGNY